MSDPSRTIAFQGAPGAYSDLACRTAFPAMTSLPCATFEDAFAAVREKRAQLAMIPIENSVAGRVADIHHLMPDSGLHIIGEHFQRVNHHLLAIKGATHRRAEDRAQPYPRAAAMPASIIAELGLKPIVHADTAGAAADVAARAIRARRRSPRRSPARSTAWQSLRADVADHASTTRPASS